MPVVINASLLPVASISPLILSEFIAPSPHRSVLFHWPWRWGPVGKSFQVPNCKACRWVLAQFWRKNIDFVSRVLSWLVRSCLSHNQSPWVHVDEIIRQSILRVSSLGEMQRKVRAAHEVNGASTSARQDETDIEIERLQQLLDCEEDYVLINWNEVNWDRHLYEIFHQTECVYQRRFGSRVLKLGELRWGWGMVLFTDARSSIATAHDQKPCWRGCGRGSSPPTMGVRGCYPRNFLKLYFAIS